MRCCAVSTTGSTGPFVSIGMQAFSNRYARFSWASAVCSFCFAIRRFWGGRSRLERFGLTLVLFSLMNPFRFYRWHVFDSVCSLRWAVKKKAALPVLVEARPHSVKATGQFLEGSGPEPVWSSVGAWQQVTSGRLQRKVTISNLRAQISNLKPGSIAGISNRKSHISNRKIQFLQVVLFEI
jgi:hypothetical protein